MSSFYTVSRPPRQNVFVGILVSLVLMLGACEYRRETFRYRLIVGGDS